MSSTTNRSPSRIAFAAFLESTIFDCRDVAAEGASSAFALRAVFARDAPGAVPDARLNAVLNSLAVGKRLPGSLAIARWAIASHHGGRSARCARRAVGRSEMCFCSITTVLSALKGPAAAPPELTAEPRL